MDFSALNPNTSNSLNLAARRNDIAAVKRLLRKKNPSCVDNRGWTCLHEAAASDSYESLLLILQHKDCRPLAETHEGHTALYLACRSKSSLRTLKALLSNTEDIANYGSTENTTPLHVVSAMGWLEAVQLLIDYGAMLNVQDLDGDTPLHDAALKMQYKTMDLLLHAGAYPDIRNRAWLTPFHLACCGGSFESVKTITPFISDINETSYDGDSPLLLGTLSGNVKIIKYLLKHGADPHIENEKKTIPLDIALRIGNSEVFKILFDATDKNLVSVVMVSLACRPHYFSIQILEQLLVSELDIEYFSACEFICDQTTEYKVNRDYSPYGFVIPLGCYLSVCEYIYKYSRDKFRELFYLFLMRGVQVNAFKMNECPALVYIHYKPHTLCFGEVFQILLDQGCNVDYCSLKKCTDIHACIPDAFIAALYTDSTTVPLMMPYSSRCEPGRVIELCRRLKILPRVPPAIVSQLLKMIEPGFESLGAAKYRSYVPSLKHLSRMGVRKMLRAGGVKSTKDFFTALRSLPVPPQIQNYIRFA